MSTSSKTETRTWNTIRRSLLIFVAASLLLGAQAWALETRLPANRTYLAFIQGLEDGPLDGAFSCLVFTPDGKVQAGEDSGDWSVKNNLSKSRQQYVISLEFTIIDDEDGEIQIDGLCWVDTRGSANTLTCSAHAEAAGIRANFGLTARPLGGQVSADAQARCQAKADTLNASLGVG